MPSGNWFGTGYDKTPETMLQFAWPYLFAALPLPLLSALLLPSAAQRSQAALRIPFYQALETTAHSRQTPRWRLLLGILAWILLVMAAARPQFVGEPLELPVSGRDLLLAVDISGSMQTRDMELADSQVTRLTAVKAVAGDFIQRRVGDQLGLILFGSQAYLQTPLTFDRKTVNTLLQESELGLAGKRTAIGNAIGLAVKRVQQRPEETRVLILLTDGANTSGEMTPLRAADLAAQEGLRIYTIGVGADEMIVASLFGNRRVNPSADLDEDTLTAIADKTGGRYFRARDSQALEQIYQSLDQLEPISQEKEIFRPVQALYHWPLALALLITLLLAIARIERVIPI